MKQSPLIVVLLLGLAACEGDEAPLPVREVDVESRRVLVGGPDYDFDRVAIDHDQRVVYATDASMPERILRVPLDGGPVRAFGRGGDGPGEMESVIGITPADDGGIFATNSEKLVRFDAAGETVASWSADGLVPTSLCTLRGRPAAAAGWHGIAWCSETACCGWSPTPCQSCARAAPRRLTKAG